MRYLALVFLAAFGLIISSGSIPTPRFAAPIQAQASEQISSESGEGSEDASSSDPSAEEPQQDYSKYLFVLAVLVLILIFAFGGVS